MNHDDDSETRDESPKLPYEAPCIVETAEFETLAMACTKQSLLSCRAGTQLS